jgi:hypothetical protein
VFGFGGAKGGGCASGNSRRSGASGLIGSGFFSSALCNASGKAKANPKRV